MAPEYARAASMLKEQNIPAVLGKLDSTVNQKTSTINQVDAYPTLKLFKNGTVLSYPGDRTVRH